MMEKCFDEGTLQAFLDNELAPELSQAIARHMVDCDPCAILLAEVEEETAFTFTALEQEFNTLVPTMRLWTKINDSIETQSRNRSVWQKLLSFVAGLNLLNPQIIAFGSLLLIVGVVSVLLVMKEDSKTVAFVPTNTDQSVPKVTIPQPVNLSAENTPPVTDTKETKNRTPQIRVEKADFVESKPTSQSPIIKPPIISEHVVVPQYLDGEESYVSTISRLEKTVDNNKDEVLKSSARFSYEKDLAIVNDSIKKMKREVKKNPKNEDAKQVLFSSYQNKIELLNSVTQRSELMASMR
jgi:hypothetical protein